jgi:hypothetical protein
VCDIRASCADADCYNKLRYGLRAGILNLRTYWFSYGLHTVKGIISRWAPADDTIGSILANPKNNPSEYTDFVCEQTNLGPTQELELFRPDKTLGNVENLWRLISAMAKFENSADFTFPRGEFLEALKLVQPGFTTSDVPSPSSEAKPVAVTTADKDVLNALEDPLKDLSNQVLQKLKLTTTYELIELLLNRRPTPMPPEDRPVDPSTVSSTSRPDEFVLNERVTAKANGHQLIPTQ